VEPGASKISLSDLSFLGGRPYIGHPTQQRLTFSQILIWLPNHAALELAPVGGTFFIAC
jgi:hypothetical protein